MTEKQTIQIAESGDTENGLTKTFAEIVPNLLPKGSYNLRIYTTYNKAKDPDGQQTKIQMTVNSDSAKNLIQLLKKVK